MGTVQIGGINAQGEVKAQVDPTHDAIRVHTHGRRPCGVHVVLSNGEVTVT